MKKTIATISGMLIILMIAFAGMIFNAASIKVSATSDAFDLHKAVYIGGLYGYGDDGHEIALFIYEKDNKEIAFLGDGKECSLTTIDVDKTGDADHKDAEKLILSGNIELTYYEENGVPYLLSDNGYKYTCEYFTANAAEHIIDLY